MELIDENLINRAVQGDIGAFELIYRAASVYVYTLALRITRNKEDAHDVTQEVFLRVYRCLDSFNRDSSFKTWIHRIAVNTAINTAKKSSKEQGRRGDFDIALETAGSSERPDAGIEKTDNERRISILLGALTLEQRACIVLREVEGMDYREISEVLKININTVRTRLRRAREAILELRKSEVGL